MIISVVQFQSFSEHPDHLRVSFNPTTHWDLKILIILKYQAIAVIELALQ